MWGGGSYGLLKQSEAAIHIESSTSPHPPSDTNYNVRVASHILFHLYCFYIWTLRCIWKSNTRYMCALVRPVRGFHDGIYQVLVGTVYSMILSTFLKLCWLVNLSVLAIGNTCYLKNKNTTPLRSNHNYWEVVLLFLPQILCVKRNLIFSIHTFYSNKYFCII